MRAMVLRQPAMAETSPLILSDIPVPEPQAGEVLVRVEVCGVCRTDLHVAEGDLPPIRSEIVPGHEVVGLVEKSGPEARGFRVGDRIGVAWLHRTCGVCAYCVRGDENLCVAPQFTGYTVNGGFAEFMTADEAFVYPIPEGVASTEAAPFLCAGIIGYRALRRSDVQPGQPIGLYGFGASAHIVIQIARYWGCPVYVFSRGDRHQALAREMGAIWVGPADARPPVKLRAGILFAPAGELVPVALDALDRGGTLALAGIYMTPIPEMDYARYLFEERNLRSVTANTRRDGRELIQLAAQVPLRTRTEEFPLEEANAALQKLKGDGINGAAVLRVAANRS
ncbi:MAG TPA: zinc-dependent alcohol dehydrogenase family protein [Chthonomonadaceae bacterium]|nr:zinc-dependent alcohol dehydrogenase family protein [Chthonomonadaceae bacterium]